MEKKKLIGVFVGVVAVCLLVVAGVFWGVETLETYAKAKQKVRQQAAELESLEKRAIKAEKQLQTWWERAQKAEEALKAKEAEAAPAVSSTQTTPAPATPAPGELAPPVKVVVAKEVPEELKIAIVGKGEGIEHALIRQLIAVPELYGFKGDTGDKKAVKKWAQTKAHQIAILAGYVDVKTGNEVRVKGSGGDVAYVLQADSDLKMSIVQHCKDNEGNFSDPTNPNPEPELVKTLELAKDYQSVTFQGNIDVRPYEYLFFKEIRK